ncbi:hypothetical protein DIS24_g12061 [Lasiodiplodia hormozganensis]|uniref:Uncharacterized protein n=1 Tax=Lasiodiplodia hormozganensis TaxID=869390 RepID=A0AA39TM97_9PEZI|nr:hypothetical protein DIS24_g12061 [Lasiodiplodia hormozganensis]
MPISTSPLLRLAATAFGIIPIVFGINAMLRPAHGLSFFEPFTYPAYDPPARELVDALMVVYGARDIFWGLATLVPLYYGSRKITGAMLIAGSAVAGVDGAVCKAAGGGEWVHWGYAPVLAVVGGLLMT